jgi:hypothetical protein
MKINLNRRVRVKLNRHGQNILVNFYSRVVFGHIQDGREYCDAVYSGWRDGLIETQLWNIFEVFGPKMLLGGAIPFELNELELLPDDPFSGDVGRAETSVQQNAEVSK